MAETEENKLENYRWIQYQVYGNITNRFVYAPSGMVIAELREEPGTTPGAWCLCLFCSHFLNQTSFFTFITREDAVFFITRYIRNAPLVSIV